MHTADLKRDFSASIDLKRLERESRGLLRIGFLAGIAIQIGLLLLMKGGKAPVNAAYHASERRVVTDLVPVPPFPREPVTIFPKTRVPHYSMKPSFHPRLPGASLTTPSFPVPGIRNGEIPPLGERRMTDITERFLSSLTTDATVPRVLSDAIPLPEYLIPDTGTYTAEVVIPPGQKRAVQGYLHIPCAWGGLINTPDTLCMRNIGILADNMNRFTNIRTEPVPHRIRLEGGGDTRTYPLIYIAVDAPFELTESEIAALAGHMGSLIVIDNVAEDDRHDRIGDSVKKLTDKLLTFSWGASIIPSNHSFYHCFFDIPAPLIGNYVSSEPLPDHLKMIGYFAGSQRSLVLIYFPKGLCRSFANQRGDDMRRLAVNMIVFALTRYKEWYFPETGELRYVAEQPSRSW